MLSKRIMPTALIALGFVITGSHVMSQQSEMLREEFHQTFPLAADGRVSLGNINGAVRVTGWDRNEVKVDAVKMAYRRDRLAEAKIEVQSDASSIRIETQYPTRSQTFSDGDARHNNPAVVEYTLMVPRNARIDSIELINGDLDVGGISGQIKASSINGRVSAHELMGDVKLSTINGKLDAMFGRLNESRAVSLGSVNGSVLLTIPSDSNAELRASTVHGVITNDFGLPVRRGEYVGRDLAGLLGQGGARIKVGNVNGAITIRHAPDGRPLSRATNMLAEKVKDKVKEKDDADDFDPEDAKSESRREARDAVREAVRARVEAQRAQVEAQRAKIEAQRAQRHVEIEAQRAKVDARRAPHGAQRAEAQRAAVEAQRAQRQVQVETQRLRTEIARGARSAQRITQQEVARIRTEAQRVARQLGRVDMANVDAANTLRLVERESKSFTVSGTPRVNLQTFDGNITVHGWDKQEVQLTVSKRAANEQQMRGIKVRSDHSGSDVNVVADFDDSFARREGELSFTGALVNLDVYVPRSSTIRLSSGDGRLELEGVNGTLDLNTGDGRIEVRDSSGRLVARTGDGRIQVEKFSGEVEARTGDGRVFLDGKFAKLAAQTGSGTIMLMLPEGSNATIETDAQSIDNESGLTITEDSSSSKRLKRWKLGKGGNVFSLRTADGRIILRRAGQ